MCVCVRERERERERGVERGGERDLEHSNRGDLGPCSVVGPKEKIFFAVEMHILITTKDYSIY